MHLPEWCWESGRVLIFPSQCTKEDYTNGAAAAQAAFEADPSNFLAHIQRSWNKYQLSMQIFGENTLENAKKLGYLDARWLYPDIEPFSLEEAANEFYSQDDPAVVYKDVVERLSRS